MWCQGGIPWCWCGVRLITGVVIMWRWCGVGLLPNSLINCIIFFRFKAHYCFVYYSSTAAVSVVLYA